MAKVKKITPYIFVVFLFTIIFSLYEKTKPPIVKDNEEGLVALKLDKQILNAFSLGQQRLLSSFLWIETMLNADHKPHKNNLDRSALYYKYKTIADLDPFFYELYLNGGIYLSIIKDDKLGAKNIYDRALEVFPTDYDILYNAGFHYYFELAESEKALTIFNKIIQFHPYKTPMVISTLVAKLQLQKKGTLEEARVIIFEAWKRSPEGSAQKNALFSRLYSIQTEIDLKCLNSGQKNCNEKDIDGEKYIKVDNQFVSIKKWRKFRLKKKSN